MKKAMLFMIALLFSVGASAATITAGTTSGASATSVGDAYAASSNKYVDGAPIKDYFNFTTSPESKWVFTLTANSNVGALPDPFFASVDGGTVFNAVGDTIHFVLNLLAGSHTLNVGGTANYTLTGYDVAINAVPVPAALWLFAPALLGFFGLRRKSSSQALVAA